MKFRALFFPLLLLSDFTAESADYFPVFPGNTWTYRLPTTWALYATTQVTHTQSTDTVINGCAFIRHKTSGTVGGFPVAGKEYYSEKDNDIFQCFAKTPSGDSLVKISQHRFNGPASWTNNGNDTMFSIPVGSFSTPAGTFNNVHKVFSKTGSFERFYSPDVGLICFFNRSGTDTSNYFLLSSYSAKSSLSVKWMTAGKRVETGFIIATGRQNEITLFNHGRRYGIFNVYTLAGRRILSVTLTPGRETAGPFMVSNGIYGYSTIDRERQIAVSGTFLVK